MKRKIYLTKAEFEVMKWLDECPDQRHSKVRMAKELGIARMTIHRAINELEFLDLIRPLPLMQIHNVKSYRVMKRKSDKCVLRS